MPLLIVRNDITKMTVDAIVNAANNTLLGGGGVDGAIHRAAGPKLLAECRTLGGCDTGDAKITGAYDLNAKYVIHTVGPIWYGGERGEESLLRSCYKKSLELAVSHGCESIAFPLISAGVYGYPINDAINVAKRAITDFLADHELNVYMVIYDKTAMTEGSKIFREIKSYIDDRYAAAFEVSRRIDMECSMAPRPMAAPTVGNTAPSKSESTRRPAPPRPDALTAADVRKSVEAELNRPGSVSFGCEAAPEKEKKKFGLFGKKKKPVEAPDADVQPTLAMTLDDAINQLDESFSQMLLRKIDESGMTDVECYKKANIDRKLFSKIRSDMLYKPSKTTVIAFAIALELPIGETRDMLMKAGFALSHSNKFDIIIEYFIERGNYDIFEINEALFAFDQVLLGA